MVLFSASSFLGLIFYGDCSHVYHPGIHFSRTTWLVNVYYFSSKKGVFKVWKEGYDLNIPFLLLKWMFVVGSFRIRNHSMRCWTPTAFGDVSRPGAVQIFHPKKTLVPQTPGDAFKSGKPFGPKSYHQKNWWLEDEAFLLGTYPTNQPRLDTFSSSLGTCHRGVSGLWSGSSACKKGGPTTLESEIDEAWGKCIYDICDETTTIKEYHIRFGNFVFVFQWFSMFCHVSCCEKDIGFCTRSWSIWHEASSRGARRTVSTWCRSVQVLRHCEEVCGLPPFLRRTNESVLSFEVFRFKLTSSI